MKGLWCDGFAPANMEREDNVYVGDVLNFLLRDMVGYYEKEE